MTHGTDTEATGTPDAIASRPSLRSDTEGGPVPAGAALRFRLPAGARPFPAESGNGIEDRESAARTGEHTDTATETSETGPRFATEAPGERSPSPGSVRKIRLRRDAYRGWGRIFRTAHTAYRSCAD